MRSGIKVRLTKYLPLCYNLFYKGGVFMSKLKDTNHKDGKIAPDWVLKEIKKGNEQAYNDIIDELIKRELDKKAVENAIEKLWVEEKGGSL